MLTTSLSREDLARYTALQCQSFFPDRPVTSADFGAALAESLDRLEFCFSRSRAKYTVVGDPGQGHCRFDHQNTDHYASFLYFLSNTLAKRGQTQLAAKTYALNKALHAVDIFYEVDLPAIFHLQHPVGTVLGRAKYADYFVCYQRASVGSSLEGDYPEFEEGVVLFGGSGVIGKCRVGSNSWLSVNTLVMDQNVEPGSTVFGQSPSLIRKPARRQVRGHFFAEPVGHSTRAKSAA